MDKQLFSIDNGSLYYPRNWEDNVIARGQLLQMCEKDPAIQAKVYELCANDLIFWIDMFCYTKDPRRKPDVLPFICYEAYQEKYAREIEQAINEQYDCLTDKSRDMGVSWIVLYVFMHKWLFEDGSDFRVGSRKEEFVDRANDIDTLFEKIRFNFKRQPTWLMPKGFDWRTHSTYMKMINPNKGNAIIGESANEDFGSGGRRKAILLDEYSKWETRVADAAWTATADVSKCRLPVSTPKGSGNKFALLAKGTKEKIKRITLHWTLHPQKTKGAYYLDEKNGQKMPIDDPHKAFGIWQKLKGKSAEKFGLRGGLVRSIWYDEEAERRSDADLAQEVDIDYLRSGYPFFSLASLSLQRVWKYMVRKLPTDPIPYGNYIRIRFVEIDNKLELRETPGGWLKIYELPKKDHQYAIGADTSEGLVKGDEAFGVVRNKWTRNVAATFNGLYATDDFAVNLQQAGRFFNNADVAPENNNHGHSVCQDLKNMDCKLYYTKKLNESTGKISITKAGFSTTSVTRPLMLDQLEEEIRRNSVELRDEDLIAQCETFIKNEKTGKPEADGVFLDDGIIAMAICGIIIQEIPFKAKASQNIKQAQRVKELTKKKRGY